MWWRNVVKCIVIVSSVLLTRSAQSMQTSGIFILASPDKHLSAYRTLSDDLFSCFFMFLMTRQRRRLNSSFSLRYFSTSFSFFLEDSSFKQCNNFEVLMRHIICWKSCKYDIHEKYNTIYENKYELIMCMLLCPSL